MQVHQLLCTHEKESVELSVGSMESTFYFYNFGTTEHFIASKKISLNLFGHHHTYMQQSEHFPYLSVYRF